MRKIIKTIFIISVLNFYSCSNQNYNISDLQSEKMKYDDLPIQVKEFIQKPSKEYKEYTSDGFYVGVKPMVCIKCNDFKLETVKTFVSSWVDYYKIIDLKNNKTYKIDYGAPFPYIIFNNKLYIPTIHNILIGNLDTKKLEFMCYTLK